MKKIKKPKPKLSIVIAIIITIIFMMSFILNFKTSETTIGADVKKSEASETNTINTLLDDYYEKINTITTLKLNRDTYKDYSVSEGNEENIQMYQDADGNCYFFCMNFDDFCVYDALTINFENVGSIGTKTLNAQIIFHCIDTRIGILCTTRVKAGTPRILLYWSTRRIFSEPVLDDLMGVE